MRRTVLTALLTVTTALAVPAGATAPAMANTTHDLGLTSYRALEVDEATGHVFVSGTNDVVVTDLTGARLGSVTDLPGAGDLALSDDGATLFVALSGSNSVAEIDAADPLGAGAVTLVTIQQNACPTDLAYASGLVWVAATCDHQTADLYTVDPADGSVHKVNGVSPVNPVLYASPRLSNTLFVDEPGVAESVLSEYATAGGTTPSATLVHTQSDVSSYSYAVDAAGAHVTTGYGRTFRTSDLVAGTSYRRVASDAVAQRASDGMLAFGGGTGPVLYKPGAGTPYRVYDLGATSPLVESDALAFGARDLYAVTSSIDSTAYRLRVITPRRQATATVTTSSRHVAYGTRVRVTVSVNRRDKHAKVSVYAAHLGRRPHLVTTGTVDRRGHYAVRARVTEHTVFSAVVHDNPRYDGVTRRARAVKVTAAVRTRYLGPNRPLREVCAVPPEPERLIGGPRPARPLRRLPDLPRPVPRARTLGVRRIHRMRLAPVPQPRGRLRARRPPARRHPDAHARRVGRRRPEHQEGQRLAVQQVRPWRRPPCSARLRSRRRRS